MNPTREQKPFALYASHPNWIDNERRVALKTGDYTIEGLESLLALERKSLADLMACTVTYRARFLAECQRLTKFGWKTIGLVAFHVNLFKQGYGQPIPDVTTLHPGFLQYSFARNTLRHG